MVDVRACARLALRLAALASGLAIATGCSGGETSSASATAPPSPASSLPAHATLAWRPIVSDAFQIQYAGDLDTSFAATIYDVDAVATPLVAVAALHAAGRRLLCYVNAGAYETYRPDASAFPATVLGKTYVGYPDERWLDIRRIDLLAPIMRGRLDTCVAKGFDGVDPDNVDGYQNDTGFPLSAMDQLAYDRWFATEAHARGLAVGLKNDGDQVAALAPSFEFAVTEDCYHQGNCDAYAPFLRMAKPVFSIEYTESTTVASFLTSVCPRASVAGAYAVLKHRALDAFRTACPSR